VHLKREKFDPPVNWAMKNAPLAAALVWPEGVPAFFIALMIPSQDEVRKHLERFAVARSLEDLEVAPRGLRVLLG
jgi:hypothetical protein